MKIATVNAQGRGKTDLLLAEAAANLRTNGIKLIGIVKVLDYISTFENGCDVKVFVLPDGPVIPITQSLGKGSDSCRLDPGAIATAVSMVEQGPLDTADLFILNKFGPEEAAGRGFCAVIGQALSQGIPVLVGVGNASRAAFDTFAEGLAETLPADSTAISEWCISAIAEGERVETA